MDEKSLENEKLLLFQQIVECFEKYEKAVIFMSQPEAILQCQDECLQYIEELILLGNTEPYFTAKFFIRSNLLSHIEKIKTLRDQITINDITITRITEPVVPTLTEIFPTQEQINEEHMKEPNPENEQGIILKKPKLQSEDKLRNIIKNTLVVPQAKDLSEIAGLTEAKAVLREAIIFPIKFPQLFTDGRKKWNKALLYGPPGTGKTQLAHCLAAEVEALFYCISNADLWSSYVGESEKLVKILFQHCQETNKQCLIFIDEIDSISRVRSSRETENERRFKNQLLTQLSEMDRNPNNKIFFLACTNCPWDLDPAFIRRFQRRIYVPLPNREARLEILKRQTKSLTSFTQHQFDHILDQTEGWSGSDINDLINFAMFQPMKELETADQWILTEDHYFIPVKESPHSTLKLSINDVPANKVRVRPVELTDFFVALQNVTKTVSSESLKKFEDFNYDYGSLQKIG